MNTTVKIQKLQNAIEAIRALGEGYEGYAYVIEKLQDEITVLQHAEKAAQEKAEHDAWVASYWARYEEEQSLKQELKAKLPQLRAAVHETSEVLKACRDAREWPELDYNRRMAMSELEDVEKQLRWL